MLSLVLLHSITATQQPITQTNPPTDGPWSDHIDTTWYDANQTTLNISTAKELAGLASLVNGGNRLLGQTINLLDDIELEDHYWIPIGHIALGNIVSITSGSVFRGTFNGNNRTIKNVITYPTNANISNGLFGVIGENGKVENLQVTGEIQSTTEERATSNREHIYPSNSCIVGIIFRGTVDNCTAYCNVMGRQISAGIAGYIINSTISNSTNHGNITANKQSGLNAFTISGGIFGDSSYFGSLTHTIFNCRNTGSIRSNNGNGSSYAGGIGGGQFDGHSVIIKNSYNTGTVSALGSGANRAACGIISINLYSSLIENCFNSGEVGNSEIVEIAHTNVRLNNCHGRDGKGLYTFPNTYNPPGLLFVLCYV